MQLTLVRHATLLLELAGVRLLVDPMLDDAGARPPIDGTPNQVRNPTVPLPWPGEEVVQALDLVIVTHLHRDHLDGRAEELLPREVPVVCQPEDAERLAALGLDVRPLESSLSLCGLSLTRTRGRHGSGALAEAMAPVMGVMLRAPGEPPLYLAGDTVWYEDVEATLVDQAPAVVVVNAGGARFLEGGPITMTAADVAEVAARVPRVVAVHLESINHCLLTRAELRAAVPGLLVPADGETLSL